MKMNNSTITYLGFAIVQHAGNPTPVLDHLCAIDRGRKERIGINLIKHMILQEKATAGTLGINVLRVEKYLAIKQIWPFLKRCNDADLEKELPIIAKVYHFSAFAKELPKSIKLMHLSNAQAEVEVQKHILIWIDIT